MWQSRLFSTANSAIAFARLRPRPLVIVSAGVVLSAMLVDLGVHLDLGAQDWAAWVQAIGSIGAIVGAFMLVDRQIAATAEADNERRKKEQLQKVEILWRLFGEILDALEILQKALDEQRLSAVATSLSTLQAVEGIMKALPTFEIPNEVLAFGVFRTSYALAEVNQVGKQWVETTNRLSDTPGTQVSQVLVDRFSGARNQAFVRADTLKMQCMIERAALTGFPRPAPEHAHRELEK